jgi:hypothetical protein
MSGTADGVRALGEIPSGDTVAEESLVTEDVITVNRIARRRDLLVCPTFSRRSSR